MSSSEDEAPSSRHKSSKKRLAPDSDEEQIKAKKKAKLEDSEDAAESRQKKDKKDKKDKKHKDKKDKKVKKDKKHKDKKDKKHKDKKEEKSSKTANSDVEEQEVAEPASEKPKKDKKKHKERSENEEDQGTTDMDDQQATYGHAAMDPELRKLGEIMTTENKAAGNMLDAVKARKNLLWGPKPSSPAAAPASTAGGRNDWSQSKFTSSADKAKFLKLMGVKDAQVDSSDAGKDAAQESMFSQLESQYVQGIQMKKKSYSNKNQGL